MHAGVATQLGYEDLSTVTAEDMAVEVSVKSFEDTDFVHGFLVW